jgi:hypothetical protein
MSIHFKLLDIIENIETLDCLNILNFFKSNFNNKLFIKKISETILLIHNNYNKEYKDEMADLFNECKSIVIDISNKPKIVSYTHDNIKYYVLEDYIMTPDDLYEESYEGTLISVFFHDERWILTTSRCSDIEKSYYYNKNKNFSIMFDECLQETRQEFLSKLDKEQCYYFVLIHHENKNLIDYSKKLGPDYKVLMHILTRNKETQINIDIKLDIKYIRYPKCFKDFENAKEHVIEYDDIEGIIVKRTDTNNKLQMSKIYSNKFYEEKTKWPQYANRWYSYIELFQKNNKDFSIQDFQNKKAITEEIIIYDKMIDITGMIYNVIKITSENIYNLIMLFTTFDVDKKIFEKKNNIKFEILNTKECLILKRQITILQNLIAKDIIKNANGIVKHLRNHVSVIHIVDILHGIKYLLETTNMIKYNKYYKQYINYIIDKVNE